MYEMLECIRRLCFLKPILLQLKRKMSSKHFSASHQIYSAAIKAVSPYSLVQRVLNFDPNTNTLRVGVTSYLINKNVKLVAFGKAVLGMVAAAEETLGDHVVEGVASVPVGTVETAKRMFSWHSLLNNTRVRVYEGAKNNLPDATAEVAARHILSVAENAGEDDVVMVMVSGGGSALLPCPVEGISLSEKRQAIETLSKHGATINELNAFRKAISRTKGGRLAEAAFPAKVITLILSDVIGDPLDVIASGPTVPNVVSTAEVLQILEKYNLMEKVPPPITSFLRSREALKPNGISVHDGEFSHVQNLIVGSNRVATAAASEAARQLGYDCHVWSHRVQGEARLLGQAYARITHCFMQAKSLVFALKEQAISLFEEEPFQKLFALFPEMKEDFTALLKMLSLNQDSPMPICFISAGEPTVTVRGGGKGGRNQELALAFSIELHQLLKNQAVSESNSELKKDSSSQCVFLSIGTDGQDGPCDAAGAVVDMETIDTAIEQGIDPVKCLEDNDSYTFFSSVSRGGYLIKTGLTGTNVMDLHVLFVYT